MTEKDIELKGVFQLLLPKEIFEYFEIIAIDTNEKEIHIYLDEINQPPEIYKKQGLIRLRVPLWRTRRNGLIPRPSGSETNNSL